MAETPAWMAGREQLPMASLDGLSQLPGILEQRIAALVARTRDDSVDGHQQGAVVGPQREHGGVDMGAGQELLKHARIRHR